MSAISEDSNLTAHFPQFLLCAVDLMIEQKIMMNFTDALRSSIRDFIRIVSPDPQKIIQKYNIRLYKQHEREIEVNLGCMSLKKNLKSFKLTGHINYIVEEMVKLGYFKTRSQFYRVVLWRYLLDYSQVVNRWEDNQIPPADFFEVANRALC